MKYLIFRPRFAPSCRSESTSFHFDRRLALIAVVVGGVAGTGACGTATFEDAPATTETPLVNRVKSAGAQVVVTTPVADGLGSHQVVVGYSGADPLILYNGDRRMVRRNASRMYRALLTPESNTSSGGRVAPPPGWPVLWGEPAITRNRVNPNLIYLTNVAVPNAKFPAAGYIVNELETRIGLPAGYCDSYLGGACIARSTDGGRTFAISDADCVRRVTGTCTEGAPYVATALETSPEGRVYAAYTDRSRGLVDVYMASGPTGSFTRVTDSPTTVSAPMGPRLKYGPGGLYMLVRSGSSLYLTRYEGGSSHNGTWTPKVLVASGSVEEPIHFPDGRYIELRTQYDLDIGPSDDTDEPGVEVRIAYAIFDGGTYRVRVARCTTGTPITCATPLNWAPFNFPIGEERFGPTIAYVQSADGAPKWALSWYDRRAVPHGPYLELWRGNVRANPDRLTELRQEPFQVPCPSTQGYWGYYDGMAAGPDGFTVRGFSDSGREPCNASFYRSVPLGASVSSWTE
jgi:hypothetical protein